MMDSMLFTLKRESHSYSLMKKDFKLLEFELEEEILTETAVVTKIYHTQNKSLIHPFLKNNLNQTTLGKWLDGRFIPRNRRYMDNILASLGRKGLVGKLNATLGLTVIDDYWIKPSSMEHLTWKEVNLFDNDFNNYIANIAFTGFGDYKVEGVTSSPEFTTDGMLPKVWRKHEDRSIWLYKGGTEGFSNSGLEPYSEFYSNQVAEALGLDYVKYDLKMHQNVLCSICPNIADSDTSLISAYHVWGKLTPLQALEKAFKMSTDFFDPLIDMIIFDYLVVNDDRHMGNFGLLYDNETMEPISVAPIYDNGIALTPYYVPEKYTLEEHEIYTKTKYASMLYLGACEYDKFRSIIPKRLKSKVKSLFDFEFEPHPKYNFEENRLKLLGEVIRYRATKLLGR